MAGFAKEGVIGFKGRLVDPEQEVHDRIQKTTGVLRRKIGRRFYGDDDEPEDQCDPGFQDLVAVAGQRDRSVVSPLAAKVAARMGHAALLFNSVVGSLARDHDIVDMALA